MIVVTALHKAGLEATSNSLGYSATSAVSQREGPGLLWDPAGTRHGDTHDASYVSIALLAYWDSLILRLEYYNTNPGIQIRHHMEEKEPPKHKAFPFSYRLTSWQDWLPSKTVAKCEKPFRCKDIVSEPENFISIQCSSVIESTNDFRFYNHLFVYTL